MAASYIWTEKLLEGVAPQCRGGHATATMLRSNSLPISEGAATAQGISLIVFGGADGFGLSYNDLFAVDTTSSDRSNKWIAMQLQQTGAMVGPRPRSGHSMLAFNASSSNGEENSIASSASFIIFGGMCPLPELVVFADVWELRIKSDFMVTLSATAPGKKQGKDDEVGVESVIDWVEWRCTGDAPCARHAHASAVVGGANSSFYVFGGSDNDAPLADAFELDLTTKIWTRLVLPSEFVPREMSSAVGILNGSWLVITGGRSTDEQLLADMFVVSTKTKSVVKLEAEYYPRCCHTSLAVGAGIALLGGFCTETPSQDTDVLGLLMVKEDVNVPPQVVGMRSVPRKDSVGGQPQFGLGHSSCSTPDGKRHFVVCGLLPNVVGQSIQAYELQSHNKQPQR